MPDTQTVRSLQQFCLQRFCEHLADLAVSSDRILAEQTPHQETAPASGDTEERAGQNGAAQEGVEQAAPSAGLQDAEREAEAEDAAVTKEHEQWSDAAGGAQQEPESAEQEIGKCVEQGAEKENGPEPSDKIRLYAKEDTAPKARDHLNQQHEVRAYLMHNVPPCFFEQMVHDTLTIINKHFYNPNYKRRRPAMVAVTGWLLADPVRHLSLDQCRMLCDRAAVPRVFRCLRQMPRLQTLAIGRLNFWKIPELSLLPELLAGLPLLTTLRLEYICLPEMVVGLADKCPQLRELSLKDSEKVTDREVPHLRRCLRLTSLNISGTSVTGAGSWEILRALPALTWFEHCPFNCNSGPFLFDSREAMLSYIWEFLSPEGRAHSAQLPSVTREMALPSRRPAEVAGAEAGERGGAAGADPARAGTEAEAAGEAEAGSASGGAEAPAAAEAEEVDAGADGAATEADSAAEAGAIVEFEAAAGGVDAVPEPPDAAAADHPPVLPPSSRESSVGAEDSPAPSSRHRSPLPLSRSGSGSSCPSPRRLRIENFWLFNPKTEELALSRLCPAVRLLRLDFVFQDMGRSPDLAGLAYLRLVTRLEVNSFDSPRFSVMSEVLRQLGGQLTELSLHVCDDYTATAALETAVARWCPRLERYSFTGDYSVRLPADRGDEELDFSGLRRRHPALRELTLGGFVTGRRLLFVLAHAAGLEQLRLDGELRYLDDAGFRQLLAANPLRHLQQLWVNCSAALTLQAVVPLLFEPGSALRRLGRLSSLQGLDRAGFLELRRQVRSMNLALELVWVTPGV